MSKISDLAWKIMDDMADRSGIPRWLSSRSDVDARAVHTGLVKLLSEAQTAWSDPALEALRPILTHMRIARQKYPNGCTVLSLADEAGEVVHAVNKGKAIEDVRGEILDTAGVAVRLYLGEVDEDLVVTGLQQRRRVNKKP